MKKLGLIGLLSLVLGFRAIGAAGFPYIVTPGGTGSDITLLGNTTMSNATLTGTLTTSGYGSISTPVTNPASLYLLGWIPFNSTNWLAIYSTNATAQLASTNWLLTVSASNVSGALPSATTSGGGKILTNNMADSSHLIVSNSIIIAQTNANAGLYVTNGANYVVATNGYIKLTYNLSAGNSITSGGSLTVGSQATLYGYSSGGLRITDSGASKDRLWINGTDKQLSSGVACPVFKIATKTNNPSDYKIFVGGNIDYQICCTDNTDVQSLVGSISYSAANINGVWKATNCFGSITGTNALSGGTLTATWIMQPTVNAAETNITVYCIPTTSLTPAASQFYMLWQCRNNGTNAITASTGAGATF